MPAAMPTTAPLTSFVTFSVTSRLGELDLLADESCARSVMSWTAWPSSDVVVWSSGHVSRRALEDAGEDERAGERGADEDLGALGRRRRLVDDRRAGAVAPRRGGGRGAGVGAAGAGACAFARRARASVGASSPRLGRARASGALGASASSRVLLLLGGARRPWRPAPRRASWPRRASCAGVGRRCSAAAPRRGPSAGCGRSRLTPAGLPRMRAPNQAGRLVVAIEASAPSPASRPDQIRRLTMSLSVMARSTSAARPPQIVSTTILGVLVRVLALVEQRRRSSR